MGIWTEARIQTVIKILVLALVLPLAASAQAVAPGAPTAPPMKFGKPEQADFEAKNFVADSSAGAVVLYDYGTTHFRLNGLRFQLESERITRIKILKKSGYDVATVEVPLYHKNQSEEKLLALRGFTYNEVGGKIEKVKLEANTTFVEDRTKNVRVRKFTLPNVREGAVIEYAYTVSSDFLFNFQDWSFQREIPTRWSEFRATIPEYFDYKMVMQGYEPLALQTQEEASAQYTAHESGGIDMSGERVSSASETITARATSYHWAMQNVPALRDEPYMTTMQDYVARINFELAGERMPGQAYQNVTATWPKINSDLRNSETFGGQLGRIGFLDAALKPLVAKYPDPATRAAAVRELVMQAVKYDGTSHYFASGPLKRSYDLHRGTSADINLLFIAALRQVGLPAEPVLLSTRGHGRVNQFFPLLEQFNYVIGVLPLADKQELLLDATEPLLPIGLLPTRCLNQIGRLVPSQDGAEGRWVTLTPAQRHLHFQEIKLTMDAQGNLSGQVREEHGGYAGASAREKLSELGEKKYLTELAGRHAGWEIPSYKFNDINEPNRSLALTYELTKLASNPGAPAEFYLTPLATFIEAQNPFRQEKRTYPVDFGALRQDVIVLTLTLPAGYTAELPQPATLSLPDKGGRYLYSATSPTPGTVQFVSRLTLDKPIYGAEEYISLREFYRLALAKQVEALVIKKGGS